MILLKYRFERNLLIYFSLAYPIARGFIRAKKKEKLIGILIAGHTSPVTTPFFLPRINGFLQENTSPLSPSPIFVSQVQNGENFPEIVPQTLRACLNIAREKTVLASVIRGMHGPTCLDQRDSRLAMGIGIFSHAYSNWIASLSLSLSVDGRVVRPRMEKKGKKIRHVFWWILIGNMKPMLREGNELQRGSVKGITGVQPVNGNEIPDAVAWTWREEWEKWNFAFASLFPDHRLFLSFLSLLFFSSFHF